MKIHSHVPVAVIMLTLPFSTQAVELVGKKLELYGKVHVSLDSSDPDVAGEDTQTSVSNNSSRIGFKGQHKINDTMALLWQYEQDVKIDETGDGFANRNSFLALKGNFGEVLAGHYDTPSKTLGSKWGMFSDTAGDRRAILGAYSGYGNKLNDRGENAILYRNSFGNVALAAMYSTSNPTAEVSGSLDDNDSDVTSVSLTYKDNNLTVAAAVENWSLDPENSLVEVDNMRIAASYKMAQLKFGAIYESTDSDDDVFNRDAYGLNISYQLSKQTDIRAQYMIADDYKNVDDSGATQLAVGVFNNLDKVTQVYAVYTTTDNDGNAQYQGIDGGHGDELETVTGGDPSALSVGIVYKF